LSARRGRFRQIVRIHSEFIAFSSGVHCSLLL
jgi:hypothetical protein